LEESVHLLYREWFVNLRFPGCDGGDGGAISNGIPDGWERMPFKDALILQRGFDLPKKNRKPGVVPIYASTGINGFHDTAKVKGPGVVTGRSGTLGTVMYVHQDFWPLNTALWVKEFKRVTVLYAYFLLSNMDLQNYKGGAAVPTLNRNSIHAVEILVPNQQLQARFDEIAQPIMDQIRLLIRYNEQLREARDGLLPRLMSGSIAV
jgi:type I restriction enzyme S subunit